jgi:hypothetical protein
MEAIGARRGLGHGHANAIVAFLRAKALNQFSAQRRSEPRSANVDPMSSLLGRPEAIVTETSP